MAKWRIVWRTSNRTGDCSTEESPLDFGYRRWQFQKVERVCRSSALIGEPQRLDQKSLARLEGLGGRLGGICEYVASGEAHQKDPGISGLNDNSELIVFATSKRLLRLVGFLWRTEPSSSLIASLGYCHAASQGRAASALPLAICSAAEKSLGKPYAKSKHRSTRSIFLDCSSSSESTKWIASCAKKD